MSDEITTYRLISDAREHLSVATAIQVFMRAATFVSQIRLRKERLPGDEFVTLLL